VLSAHADVASLAQVLTGSLAGFLPPDLIEVHYARSMSDRLAGRPGRPVGLSVTAGETVLRLDAPEGRAVSATVARSVRGVVLSRTPVSVEAWIAALAAELDRVARADESARAALERFLLG
jgi:hypothetical protein